MRHFLHFHLPTAIHVHVTDIPHRLDVIRRCIRKRDVVVNGANLGAVLLAMSHFATFKTLARKDAFAFAAFAALAEPTDSLGRVLASFPRTLAPIAPNLMLFLHHGPRGRALCLVVPPASTSMALDRHVDDVDLLIIPQRTPFEPSRNRRTPCRHPWVLAHPPWLPCWRQTRGSSRG